MPRRTPTLSLALLLALASGCRDGDPPAQVTPAPEPRASGVGRLPKIHAMGNRALASEARRAALVPRLAVQADGGVAPAASAAPAAPPRIWSFDKDKADAAPAGFDFAASAGKPGKWRVVADPAAPSGPNVLAQLDADPTEGRFLTAVAAEPSLRDARVSVRCKPVSGKVDQACGLVLRFQDPKDYYVARFNALEKDFNLYAVKEGKRTLVGGWKSDTINAAWHEVRVDARGDHLELYWEGTRVYEATDKTFPDAGRFGLWTKADAVTQFDELSVTAL